MKNKLIAWLIPIILGVAIWFMPIPEGVKPEAWHLFAIFVATIIAFITGPASMGTLSILAIVLTSLTGVLKIGVALSGFANSTIWLIVAAFLLSRGFINTGLGQRIAYILIKLFGKSPIRLAYTLLVSDLILAPATPSNTARTGGVVYPITRSLASAFGSEPDGTRRKIGAYLVQVISQTSGVTSAMFMTSNAPNPMIVSLVAASFGIAMSWGGWAIAGLVPGIVSLLLIPIVLYKLYPPEITDTRMAQDHAEKELEKMGSFSFGEKIMLIVFIGCLVLWATGTITKIDATTVALLGVVVLLLTGVISWSDVKKEQGAWDTLVWMGTLIALATQLSKLGFIPWLADVTGAALGGISWVPALIILFLIYYYIHYMFASLSAHAAALYIAFTTVAIGCGAPVMLTLYLFAFANGLFLPLTHYASGPAPILFGSGYVSQPEWWKLGFIFSVIYILVWGSIGSIWWKVLGLW